MSRTILLVDDQECVRVLVRQVVEEWDPQALILEAEDGGAALEQVKKGRPDLMICDVCMPVMDGFEVLASVREQPATWDMPVIMLTAENSVEALAEGYRRRATSYVTKPFNLDELRQALDYHK